MYNVCMNQRNKSIDIARGIAIISIMLGHLGNSQINRVVFTYHVPLFFLITGYFLKCKGDLFSFIKKKADALLKPYCITCMLLIVFSVLKVLLKGGSISQLAGTFTDTVYASLYGAGDSYTEPFYIPAIGAVWFLWASFWGCLIVQFSAYFKKPYDALFILLAAAAGYYSRRLFWFPLSIQAGGAAALFIYTGYTYKQYESTVLPLYRKFRVPVLVVMTAVWLEFIVHFKSFWLVHFDIGRGLQDIIASIFACVVIFALSSFISRLIPDEKLLSFTGRNSLCFLCIHLLELKLVPWNQIIGLIPFINGSASVLIAKIICKLLLVLSVMQIAYDIPFMKKAYRITIYKEKA